MNKDLLIKELEFKAVRSSGPGGQNVNKVASKVVLSFNLINSRAFSELEKERLTVKLTSKITQDGNLILSCDESRSQFQNKTIVIGRLLQIIELSLIVPKKRRPTKATKSSVEKRIKSKKTKAKIKEARKKPKF